MNIKGQPNLTTGSFCSWINEYILPNSCLESGYPRKVSIETAHQWLHQLGFEVLSATKGAYFDGHERQDVIASRKEFLKEMVTQGFLHPDQAPTPDVQRAFPADVPLASSETLTSWLSFSMTSLPSTLMTTKPYNGESKGKNVTS